MSYVTKLIEDYYQARGLVRPTIWEALGWASAELGEVYEVIMSWDGKWVRNNPQDHPVKGKEDLAEELGDVIMMLIAAGMSEGVDPLEALEEKIKRKMSKAGSSKSVTLTSSLSLISEKEVEEFEKDSK